MIGGLNNLGKERALLLFADWTDRVNRGEVPPAPARPQGLERNVVISMWDWADPKAYLHDQASTDRRNPTINANNERAVNEHKEKEIKDTKTETIDEDLNGKPTGQ
jgi:hypothetical protein